MGLAMLGEKNLWSLGVWLGVAGLLFQASKLTLGRISPSFFSSCPFSQLKTFSLCCLAPRVSETGKECIQGPTGKKGS